MGYNTNGLAHHRLVEAIDWLADEGYQSVALTLDAGALDPYDDPAHLRKQVGQVRERLDHHGMGRVVETGARYLLNPRKKHDPNLLDTDPARRQVRIEFLKRAIDLAVDLDAPVVSLWSGTLVHAAPEAMVLERLALSLQPVLDQAEKRAVRLGFEPEPGMFIDTMARFAALDERVRHPLLDLTLDVGHLHCIEEQPPEHHILSWKGRIVNVHIEDMVRGVHDHLLFGAGTIDFPPIIAAFRQIDYRGGLHVELSRHSHAAVEAVRKSACFLGPLLVAR